MDESAPDDETITLPTLDRWLYRGTALVVIAVGIAVALVALEPDAGARGFVALLGIAVVVLGVGMVVRVPRLAVHLSADTLRYVGFATTWTAPRSGIDVVLDDTTVEWHDADGRAHRRQLFIFAPANVDDGTVFARYWRWRRDGLLRVRDWADARSV